MFLHRFTIFFCVDEVLAHNDGGPKIPTEAILNLKLKHPPFKGLNGDFKHKNHHKSF